MLQPKFTVTEIAALERAYREAIYEVYSDRETIQLSIDRSCPKLDALIRQQNYTNWALITAHNPYSQSLSAIENQQRHQQLVEHLQQLEFSWLPAVGKDRYGIWTPEQSLCILGIELDRAIAIGRKFAQNAIVYGELNKPAKLKWVLTNVNSE